MATQTKAIRRKPRGWAATLNIQRVRHLVQFGFLAFIGLVMAQHALTPETSTSVVTSPEAFCPFGGVETLYKFVTTGGQYVSHAHASSIILFVAILVSAVFAKSYFCGWVCPFGTIQEWISTLSHWLQRKVSPLGSAVRWLKVNLAFLASLDPWLRYGKYLVLAWATFGAAIFGVMVFRDYDPWAALLTVTELQLGFGFGVLVLVLVASFFVERPWCRYACPLGAVIGIAGKASLLKIQREGQACAGCNLCSKKCPMGIPVETLSRVDSADCNMCLQCVGSCPRQGALDLHLSLPGLKSQAH
ncbi:MAG: 4Fe-4S binding protein [Dehalococcoidales bacterium]|nr:4Fe-4S binding protein [Dehalococcoidales bacterium]